ncbi:MAG: hypothetical protein AAF986_09430 [Pseudomonadota bacterium]
MQWMLSELLLPYARRFGGQAAAALVGYGMAAEHQAPVAAAIAWAIASVVELIVSSKNRKALVDHAKQRWGKN